MVRLLGKCECLKQMGQGPCDAKSWVKFGWGLSSAISTQRDSVRIGVTRSGPTLINLRLLGLAHPGAVQVSLARPSLGRPILVALIELLPLTRLLNANG